MLRADNAGVVELADAPDSKSGGGNSVWVQLPPPAPDKSVVKGLVVSNYELLRTLTCY